MLWLNMIVKVIRSRRLVNPVKSDIGNKARGEGEGGAHSVLAEKQ